MRYLYVGSRDVGKDLPYYRDVLGAKVEWDLTGFGARVAGVRLGPGPLILLADHRPPGTTIFIFQVDDLEASIATLRSKGWESHAGPIEVPEGPVYTFRDPTGNEFALLQITRPHVIGA